MNGLYAYREIAAKKNFMDILVFQMAGSCACGIPVDV
jgi:hypothetical protein